MDHFCAATLFILLLLPGCNEGPISTKKPVVTKPDARDFGFVGDWDMVPEVDPVFGPSKTIEKYRISEISKGIYSIEGDSIKNHTVRARAFGIDDKAPKAVIEFEILRDDIAESQYLGVVERQDNELHLRWIIAKNLIKCMEADGHSAIIEYGGFLTTPKVTAKPEHLIECLRKHSNELSDKVIVFRRVD
jgi:hypothetical protein